MKRALFFLFFLLAALPAFVGCAEDPAARAYYPPTVTPKPSPEGLQGNLQYIQAANEADRATATAAAWATMVAPPEPTPTLVPAPITHVVVEGETLIHVMGKVTGRIGSNCTPQETQKINGITDPNLIYIGQVITFPSDCRIRDGNQ